jgi:filamentous hemagglutinin family protein
MRNLFFALLYTLDNLRDCGIRPHPPTPSPKSGRRGASFKVPLLALGEGFRVRAGIHAVGLLQRVSLVLPAISILTVCTAAQAQVQQIVPAVDGTGTIVAPNGNRIDITGGQLSRDQANLFHSFAQFGLNPNEIANFLSNPATQNILARVVGGDASLINGLIQVTGSNANLYLTNPAGIVFGANASLNVPASFTATTANAIGVGNDWFNAIGSNNYAALVGTPNSFAFTMQQPGAIVNFGNLAVSTGQNLSLFGGTVLSTGKLAAPGGQITVTAVPGENLVRVSQTGSLLSLEFVPFTNNSLTPSPPYSLTPLSLPQLLTGGNINNASEVTVTSNGIVQLTGSGIPIETGDVVARDVTAQTAVLSAHNNLTLVESQLQTTGDLSLLAGNTVRVRDSVAKPFVAKSGGNLTVQGNQAIDILALNHLYTDPFQSGGNMTLVSDGVISTDAHFTAGGSFAIRTLSGGIGNFLSLYDPIINVGTNFDVGDYTGASLQVIAGGNITYGTVVINAIDPLINPTNPAFFLNAGGSVTGTGNVSTTVPTGGLLVDFQAGEGISVGGITTQGGSVTLNADTNTNGSALIINNTVIDTAGGNFVGIGRGTATIAPGINISGSTINVGNGNIILTGTGGNAALNNVGIEIGANSRLEATSVGTITLTGNGGNGVGVDPVTNPPPTRCTFSGCNIGIRINSSSVVIQNGVATLTGTGGNGTGALNNGITLLGSNAVQSTGAGGINLEGNGGNGIVASLGIEILGNSINSTNGNINLRGTGGSSLGSGNVGILMESDSVIESTERGNISLTGIGGGNAASNVGIQLGIVRGATIKSNSGNITLTGQGGPEGGAGIWLNNGTAFTRGSLVQSTSGKIKLDGTGTFSPRTGAVGVIVGVGKITSGLTTRVIAENNDIEIIGSAVTANGVQIPDGVLEAPKGNILINGLVGGVSLSDTFINPSNPGTGTFTLLANKTTFAGATLIQAGTINTTGSTLEGFNDAINLIATQDIITGNITNSGRAITLNSTNGNINTTAGTLDSSSATGDGGAITLTAAGNIATGNLFSNAAGNGGNISVTSTAGSINTLSAGANFADNIRSSTVTGSTGGAITFAAAGAITTGDVRSFATVGTGGAVSFTSTNGAINTGLVDPSGNLSGGLSGSILYNAQGNIVTGILFSPFSGNSLSNGISLTSNSGLITVPGITYNGGQPISVNASSDINLGFITKPLDSTISTSGSINLASNGTIVLANSIDTSGFNFSLSGSGLSILNPVSTGGGNFSFSGTGTLTIASPITTDGGDIALQGNVINASATLNSSSATRNGGAITLTANSNITTGNIVSSAIGTNGNAGNITLDSGGEIDTTAGSLDALSVSGNGGALTLTATGNITTGGTIGNAAGGLGLRSYTQSPGTIGGDIILRSSAGSINTTRGWLDSGSQGNAGRIILSALGDINTAALSADSSTGSGNDITLTSAEGSINTSAGLSFVSSFGRNNGGAISMNANDDIITGTGFAGFTSFAIAGVDSRSSENGSSGAIRLTSTEGSINTSAGTINSSAENGNGGLIALSATEGSIATSNLFSSGLLSGGGIDIRAEDTISTGIIDSSSTLGSGGNVLLDPVGDIQVTSINTQGGTTGGSVNIETRSLFRATGVFSDRNNTLASISTAGGQAGGNIIIRHGGGLRRTSFTVGNATQNGTAGAITSGAANTIFPTRSFPGSYTQGNIRIVTTNAPQTFCELSACQPRTNPPDRAVSQVGTPGSPGELVYANVPEPRFSEQYQSYLDLPPKSNKSLVEAQKILRNIESATGSKPALVYISFIPSWDEVQAPAAQPKSYPSPQDSEVFWRFNSEVLSTSNLAANQVSTSERPPADPTDQVEIIIVTSKGAPIRKLAIGARRKEFLATMNTFQRKVEELGSGNEYIEPAQQLYEWLIQPLKEDKTLTAQGINNLVFIPDIHLRSLPFAALAYRDPTSNKPRHLIEDYSVGLMPSLSLTDTRYEDIRNKEVLAMGAKFTGKSELATAPIQVDIITQQLWQGKVLLDSAFTPENLKSQRSEQPFGIVHLATHADFKPGEQSISESYIQFSDTKLQLNQVNDVGLNNPPVDLLVLGACRTAIGDEYSELGFAGLAAKTGVKTVLGSLWYVNQEGTLALLTDFYRQLNRVPLKAEALRQAQIAMLNGTVRYEEGQLRLAEDKAFPLPPELEEQIGSPDLSHPYYWASFTLVGNPW